MAKKTNSNINGKNYYRLRADIGYDENGKRIRKSFYGSSKKEAEQKRDEYLNGLKGNSDIDYNKITFNDFFTEWFYEVKKPSVADSSFNRYESIYRNHITKGGFLNKPLVKIKSLDIQKLYNKLTYSIADRVHVLINNFFGYCVTEQIITINPCKNTKLPKDTRIKEEKDEKLFLPANEIAILNDTFDKDADLFIFQYALATGKRQGEILAVTHNDIDIENKVIHVNKSVNIVKVIERDTSKSKRKAIIGPPKTKASIRDIPLSKTLIPNLQRHIKREKEKHLKLGIPFDNNNLLFTNRNGGSIQANHLLAKWKRVEGSLGLTECKFHILRHTFCSLLARAGVPLKTASVIMGHSRIEITAHIYTHVEDEQKAKAIDKFDDVLSNI